MDHSFWNERWQEGRIGFHQADVTPLLERHLEVLLGGSGAKGRKRILLPLCGKSHDLTYLARLGHAVVGVEFVEKAVLDYFASLPAKARREVRHGMPAYEVEDLSLLVGDFFAVERHHTGRLDAVFDRAALIAIDPSRRADYAARLAALSERGTRLLLITLAYAQEKIPGPPFSVPDDEVRRLFADGWSLERLSSEPTANLSDAFKNAGVEAVTQSAWFLARR